MKRLDRLILGELFGPWVFGAAIFTVLIMAGSFLFEVTRYLAEGVSPSVVMQLVALLLPGIVAKTLAMAVLLATLLGFGRLSGDSEIVALKAAGVSVARMMVPVAAFGLFAAALTFAVNETIVPSSAIRATQLRIEIDDELSGKKTRPTEYPLFEEGKLVGLVAARDFNFGRGVLTDAVVVTYDKQGSPTSYLYAPELQFKGEDDWRISKGSRLTYTKGYTVEFQGEAWPASVAKPSMTPEDIIAKTLRDLDALSMAQTAAQIVRGQRDGTLDDDQLANLEFGYWNKIAVPLAALVFGLVGAPLGIRNHRAGVASGFWLSVIIIFGYMLLANMMSLYARGGRIPAAAASFTPIVVGIVVGAVLIHRRNL